MHLPPCQDFSARVICFADFVRSQIVTRITMYFHSIFTSVQKKQNRLFSFRFCIYDIALYPFHFCYLQFIPADFTHPLFDGIVTDIHIHVSTLHGIGFFDDASTFPNQIAGEVMNFHTVFPVL